MTAVRPEHRLLALALPIAGDGADREIADLCSRPLDWAYLLDAGHQVGALPLLGEALGRSGAAIPEAARRACQEDLTRGIMRLLVARRVMGELREALGGAGVRFLVLKGLPLASEIYPHPGLRPIGDLDLLVQREAADAALEVLRDRGYHLPVPSLPVGFFRRHHFHMELHREGRAGLPVELHWDTQPFFSLSRIPEAEFWARARPLTVQGCDVMVPGREECFLFLAQHLMRHLLSFGPETWEDPVGAFLEPARRGRLTWIADLAFLAQSGPRLDWRRVALLSGRWGLDDEIAGLRAYLRRAGVWAGPPEIAGGEKPSTDRFPGIVQRAATLFPGLSRPTSALQVRPILAFRLFRFALPGARWIRWRYGLGDEVGRARVGWRGLWHAAATLGRASAMGAHILAFRLRNWKSRPGAAREAGSPRPVSPRGDGRLTEGVRPAGAGARDGAPGAGERAVQAPDALRAGPGALTE